MTHGEKIAIIADDYTGAGDAGIHFARIGRKVELLLHAEALEKRADRDGDVSLTSETRFLEADAAAAVVADIVRRARAAGFTRIFKKIDSTMRGNPGAEIEAALVGTGQRAAIICPAMPKTGRTCRDGIIYLDGVPLHQSDIGRDPFHPLASSAVADLLRQQTSLPVGHLSLADVAGDAAALRSTIVAMVERGTRLLIADAVTDGDLAALAIQLVHGDLLPVGAGGFSEAMAGLVANGPVDGARRIELHRPLLSVVGSLAEVSRRQAEYAGRSGRFATIAIRTDAAPGDIRTACASGLAAPDRLEPNILLRVVKAEPAEKITKANGEAVAEKLGLAAASICALTACRTIVSTGGSTSMAVAEALGIESVDLVDEILPGVVVGACNGGNGAIEWFISKAGGFGAEGLLTDIDDRCVDA